ncbi:MAG: cysteine--tRNA ligase, partial [archaeon]
MLRFYNSLGNKMEEFKPIKQGFVGMYTCGPTIYNYAHIGNLKCYTWEDLLKRYLKYKGFEVKQV